MRVRGRGCASTKVPHAGVDAEHTKALKQKAQAIHDTRVADRAMQQAGLASPTRSSWALADLCDWYLLHRVKKRPAESRTRSEGIVATLRAAFGTVALAQLTRRQIDEWRTTRVQDTPSARPGANKQTFRRTPATVNREIAELMTMLNLAVELGELGANPIARLKKLRTATVKRRTLTPDEERRLLRQLAPADRALLITGLDSLVRLGDLLDLEWRDVSLPQRVAHIRDPKDPRQGRAYDAVLSSRATAALGALERRGKYVFWHRRTADDPRDRRSGIRRMLQRACKRCDPPVPYGRAHGGITFHWATRRTGLTRMIGKGVDIKTAQDVGHWSDPRIVLEAYAESEQDARRQAVEQIAPPEERPDPTVAKT